MFSIKVIDVVPLLDLELLVFFEDGAVKKFDVKKLFEQWPEYRALENESLFKKIKVEAGGYGISWNEELDCSEGELYQNGVDVPLQLDDFRAFAENNLISTHEASCLLECSKQNIDDLVRRKKLHPIKKDQRYNLFLKCEVVARIWAKKHSIIGHNQNLEDNTMVAEESSSYDIH